MSGIALLGIGVGVLVLMSAWYVRELRKYEKHWTSVTESETFKLGLEIAKACKERDDAVEALHMLAADVRRNRPMHVAKTTRLPDIESKARMLDIEAAISEELNK